MMRLALLHVETPGFGGPGVLAVDQGVTGVSAGQGADAHPSLSAYNRDPQFKMGKRTYSPNDMALQRAH